MFTATFAASEQGRDMPLATTVVVDMPDVTTAASLVIASKTRAIERAIDLQYGDPSPYPHLQQQLVLDVGLACGELIAIIKAAQPHQQPGHQLNSAAAALAEAKQVLIQAHVYLEDYATRHGRPVQNPPASLDPSKVYWCVTPEPLDIDWPAIGLSNYVTAD